MGMCCVADGQTYNRTNPHHHHNHQLYIHDSVLAPQNGIENIDFYVECSFLCNSLASSIIIIHHCPGDHD